LSEIPAYRLVKTRFSGAPFDGEGARLFGSRWSSQGRRCVYVAYSEALAILEILVHLDEPGLINAYRLFKVHLPNDYIKTLPHGALPNDWREDPSPSSTAAIGDEWLDTIGMLALAVPSAIAVRDKNFLLNPLHPSFAEVTGQAEELSLTVDQRLLTRNHRQGARRSGSANSQANASSDKRRK
jgi:RES domain-containing protein